MRLGRPLVLPTAPLLAASRRLRASPHWGPGTLRCAGSGCPSVRPRPSSAARVTVSARHQLLNLAHTWVGLAWSRRDTSPPLAPWRHPDPLPPPRDTSSLAGCLSQGTTQLALGWRMELKPGGPLPPVEGLECEPGRVSALRA